MPGLPLLRRILQRDLGIAKKRFRGRMHGAKRKKEAHIGSAQKSEEFSTGDEVHNHVEVCRVLEAAP